MIGTILSVALRAAIRGYQLVISPMLGPRCRFTPGCSAYAAEAIERHGPVTGVWLAIRRLARCHPWGGEGYDPVPPCSGHDHRRGGLHGPSCTPTSAGVSVPVSHRFRA